MRENSENRLVLRVGTGDLETMDNLKPGYTAEFFHNLSKLPSKLDVKKELTELRDNEKNSCNGDR